MTDTRPTAPTPGPDDCTETHQHAGHDHTGHSHDHGMGSGAHVHSHDEDAQDHGGHDHAGHDHGIGGHGHGAPIKALLIAFGLTATFIVAEVIGGIMANSLALLADAGHMTSDAAALALSIFAFWMAARAHSDRRTYGFHRMEILAAAINGITLLLIAGWVTFEAIQRIGNPEPVEGGLMLVVAVAGLVINLVSLTVLLRSGGESLNVRGAMYHVGGDALGSIGVIVGAVIIGLTGAYIADPIISLFIAGLIVIASLRLLREAGSILLESTPKSVDLPRLKTDLRDIEGVQGVHDVHVWTVTSGFLSMTGHLDLEGERTTDDILRDATRLLHQRYGIAHVTLQPERSAVHADDPCCTTNHATPEPAGTATTAR